MEEIEDKRQIIYNFPKDIVKTKCRQFLIPYDGNYHLYFKGVVYFYLHVKYDLCCSKCGSQIITKSESTFFSKVLRDHGKAVILIH